MSEQALILVDFQNDYFAEGKWPLKNMEQSAANAAKVLQQARKISDFIVHIRHENPAGDDTPFFAPGTEGAEIHASVAPLSDEPVITKNQINAFLDTNLRELLDAKDIKKLTVMGSMSHMCIDAIVRAASDFGYAVTVIEDTCSSHDMEFGGRTVAAEDAHAAFMFALGFGYAEVKKTDDYLNRCA
ncbi:cysteine hydrolase family protein [Parendozoicomonas haliclonae]|uniref:Streptothricin hydrolase n=2 Tax=Parendozoicomonas haliclonae TaxID=1960125 RepID=A0A1X7ANC0_9GAMM|nr:cysteine hydrolase family protein [Parendozoicomonas haliclonae]SMA49643.1 Streptothricin hydrolase [Parendozoicomonas haliclonae]